MMFLMISKRTLFLICLTGCVVCTVLRLENILLHPLHGFGGDTDEETLIALNSCKNRIKSLETYEQLYRNQSSEKLTEEVLTWYETFLLQCGSATNKRATVAGSFQLLQTAYLALVAKRGISDDARVACQIIPRFARLVAKHPQCISQTVGRDIYQSRCPTLAYKGALAKLRQAAANPIYQEMLVGRQAAALEESDWKENCRDSYNALFRETVSQQDPDMDIPWRYPFRTPQVMVGYPEYKQEQQRQAEASTKKHTNSMLVPRLRAIPIWSPDDLKRPFADPHASRLSAPFAISTVLKTSWRVFLSEVDNIPKHLWTDPYPFLNPIEGGWNVYILFRNGTFDENRCSYTPKTCAIIKEVLPATRLPYFHPYNEEAGFFRMRPGALIAPHSGPTNTVVNTHIGLRGVEGAEFYVNDTYITWKEGETFSFEDSFEHWGKHKPDAPADRVIFMVRQMHPDITLDHYHGHTHTQAIALSEYACADGPPSPASAGASKESNFTISIVCVQRNDQYGGEQKQRAIAGLNALLPVFDEVVLVDINTPNDRPPLVDTLTDEIRNARNLKSVVVSQAECSLLLGKECVDRMYETLGRNIGIRAAAGDIIVSSNTDIIPPTRNTVDEIVSQTMPTWRHAVTLNRWEIDLHSVTQKNISSGNLGFRQPGYEPVQTEQCVSLERFQAGQELNLKDYSVINNCGDFQMAHRELWRRAPFKDHMTGRNFADSILQASWLNAGAVIKVVNVTVHHIDHARPGNNDKKILNAKPKVRVEKPDGRLLQLVWERTTGSGIWEPI